MAETPARRTSARSSAGESPYLSMIHRSSVEGTPYTARPVSQGPSFPSDSRPAQEHSCGAVATGGSSPWKPKYTAMSTTQS